MNRKYFILCIFLMFFTMAPLTAFPSLKRDITSEIPEIKEVNTDGYKKIINVAQYKNADWSNVIGIARKVSIEEAKEIADDHPEITFFFYTKAYRIALEKENGHYRVFHQGDAVFFSGEPHWGNAPGLADGYIKQ